MTQISLPIGASNSGTNDWADVNGEDAAIVAVVNGDIRNDNIAAAGTANIAYNKMASASTGQALIGNAGTPTMTTLAGDVTVGATGTTAIGATKVTAAMLNADTQAQYRMVFQSRGMLSPDNTAGTYILGSGLMDGGSQSRMVSSAEGFTTTAGTDISYMPPDLFYFDDADYTVASLTKKLRVRAQVAVNATQAAITFTVGLYPVTVAGGADTLAYTLGTVTSGSTVAFASPAASTVHQDNSGDFTVPSDGAYALGVVTSGTLTNNSAVSIHAQVQQRSV